MFCADLHCDLLSYLAQNHSRSVFDLDVRCSLPQLRAGNVFLQTLAIYTETGKNSATFAQKQLNTFCSLPKAYPSDFERIQHFKKLQSSQKVQVVAAIENASGLSEEGEPLDLAFKRFDSFQSTAGPILYISLTWNHENRFGGGNFTTIGLKKDGEHLLEYLSGKGCAIDLSHSSDALAYSILEFIDKKNLKLIPLASHSNFRTICHQPRNLPDDLAQAIVKRGGIIGLNLFKAFVGHEGLPDIKRHVEHARLLGALDHFCFGADFFYDLDLRSIYQSPYFYPQFGNAACYPYILSSLREICSKDELEKMAYMNLKMFMERL